MKSFFVVCTLLFGYALYMGSTFYLQFTWWGKIYGGWAGFDQHNGLHVILPWLGLIVLPLVCGSKYLSLYPERSPAFWRRPGMWVVVTHMLVPVIFNQLSSLCSGFGWSGVADVLYAARYWAAVPVPVVCFLYWAYAQWTGIEPM